MVTIKEDEMRTFTESELAAMQTALHEIAATGESQFQTAERSYKAIQKHLQRLKEFMLSYEFSNTEEEIHFFKETKPLFLSRLIYFKEVFYLEAGKPFFGDTETLRQYYKQAAGRINAFFERNHHFHLYYRMGKTDQDALYFTREGSDDTLLPEYALDNDAKFSTPYSYKLAKLIAFEQLNNYLLQALYELDYPAPEIQKRLKWTDSKVALIEFAYGIFAKGAADYGKAEIKDIIATLEQAFDIDLGNHSAVFNQNIRIRKKNRTAALDQARDQLIRYMDELDEHPRYT